MTTRSSISVKARRTEVAVDRIIRSPPARRSRCCPPRTGRRTPRRSRDSRAFRPGPALTKRIWPLRQTPTISSSRRSHRAVDVGRAISLHVGVGVLRRVPRPPGHHHRQQGAPGIDEGGEGDAARQRIAVGLPKRLEQIRIESGQHVLGPVGPVHQADELDDVVLPTTVDVDAGRTRAVARGDRSGRSAATGTRRAGSPTSRTAPRRSPPCRRSAGSRTHRACRRRPGIAGGVRSRSRTPGRRLSSTLKALVSWRDSFCWMSSVLTARTRDRSVITTPITTISSTSVKESIRGIDRRIDPRGDPDGECAKRRLIGRTLRCCHGCIRSGPRGGPPRPDDPPPR